VCEQRSHSRNDANVSAQLLQLFVQLPTRHLALSELLLGLAQLLLQCHELRFVAFQHSAQISDVLFVIENVGTSIGKLVSQLLLSRFELLTLALQRLDLMLICRQLGRRELKNTFFKKME